MTELSPIAKNALAALRTRDALDPVVKARLRARIDASIAGEGHAPPTRAAIDAKGIAIRIALPVAIAAAVLLALWSVSPSDPHDATRQTSARSDQAAYGAAPEPAATAVPGLDDRTATDRAEPADEAAPSHDPQHALPQPPGVDAPVPGPAPREPAPRRKDAGERSDPPPASADTTLAQELRVLARARAALREGDPTRALAALKSHAEAFTEGQLGEDREALRVEALCAAGRVDDARAAARAFAQGWPRSPHVARVQKICASK